MKRIVWLTDVHLNFLSGPEVVAFLNRVARQEPDAILVGGDIAESPTVVSRLSGMARRLQRPIYFVLGNHDFYYGSVATTRWMVNQLTRRIPALTWLSAAGVVELTPRVGLIGHDGYADGRLGDYARSDVELSDFHLIEEIAGLAPTERLRVMQQFADEAAEHVRQVLPLACEKYREVFFLTHVPPFREAAWHQGRLSDDNWMPHFSCKAVGDAVFECLKDRPDCNLTVLCGHTHSPGEAEILPNVRVLTGDAQYGRPRVNAVFELE